MAHPRQSGTAKDIAKMLLDCRSEYDLSLTVAARQLRLSPSGLWLIEQRKTRPRPTTLVRIEKFLRRYGYETA